MDEDTTQNYITIEILSVSLNWGFLSLKKLHKVPRAEHKIIQQTVQHEWKSKSECVRRRQLKICEKFYFVSLFRLLSLWLCRWVFLAIYSEVSFSPPSFPLSIAHQRLEVFRMEMFTNTSKLWSRFDEETTEKIFALFPCTLIKDEPTLKERNKINFFNRFTFIFLK